MNPAPPWHVLQLITRADWGGAQRHVFDLATRIDPDRFRVTVACAPDGLLVDRLRGQGVAVVPMADLQREISPLQDRRTLATLSALIRSAEVDLVHCHSSKAGILGRLAARRAGIRSVFTAHGFAFAGTAAPLPARAAFLAAEWWAGRRWTDQLITVSEADRRLALAWRILPPERVRVVHNGIDPGPYETIAAPGGAGRPPVVGVVTRLVAGKGLPELLRAARLMLDAGEYRFIVAGDGPLRAALEQQARELGIAGHVSFLGFVADPVAILQQMDLCVLPSFKEGLPYGVLEAMAAGRPVVASAVGGLPEVIQDHENGRLVPRGNVRQLADALSWVAEPATLARLSIRARERIRTAFSVRQMVAAIQEVYERLLVPTAADEL